MVVEQEQSSFPDVDLYSLNSQIAKFLKDFMFIVNPSNSFEMV
jgi:hypothetical protein